MDISMPVLSGIDAARRICATTPGARILILSMHGGPEHVHRALQAGAGGYTC